MLRGWIIALLLFGVSPLLAEDKVPKYVIDYPRVKEFCLPVESFFDDAAAEYQEVDGRNIHHPIDGAFGLPIVSKVGNQHLLHLGADVAWYRIGAPVYAMADGVVRFSQPPEVLKPVGKGDQKLPPQPMGWGNLIVIEHRLNDEKYITSIYGHLGTKRFVSAGDIVKAGQVIGSVGKAGAENGGYKPHLHFGLRTGRMFEPGCELIPVVHNGKRSAITLVRLGEEELEVGADPNLPELFVLKTIGYEATMTVRDDKRWLPSDALLHMQRPEFAIVGYGLSTSGWLNPAEFLMQAVSEHPRAEFGEVPRGKPAAPNAQKAKPKPIAPKK